MLMFSSRLFVALTSCNIFYATWMLSKTAFFFVPSLQFQCTLTIQCFCFLIHFMVFFLQVLSVLLRRPYDHSCSMSIPVHFIDGTTQVSQTLGDLVCYYSSIIVLVHYRANCKQADLPTKEWFSHGFMVDSLQANSRPKCRYLTA